MAMNAMETFCQVQLSIYLALIKSVLKSTQSRRENAPGIRLTWNARQPSPVTLLGVDYLID
jgi:hypothetical protein